jgi:hypothetical protein
MTVGADDRWTRDRAGPTARPLVLLDVDGPLNPYDAKPSRRPHGYTTHRLRPKGFEHARKPLRVWLHPDHGALLRAFAERHGAELVWATTWEHDANTMIGPVIGLPELPVIEFGDHISAQEWKYPAVAKYAGGRPFVWFDDDFEAAGPDRQHALRQFEIARKTTPTLLHHVDPKIGLTEADLAAAGAWFDGIPSWVADTDNAETHED